MSEGERRLAAVMFTDMVGYTALGQRNEQLSLALVEAQQNLLRPVIARHRGREVKTMGDAFLVEFTNALEATRCAYDIQRASKEFNLAMPDEKRIHLRVGLHLGDVVGRKGDIFGDAVNVASRIEPLAEDGGVCLTRQVYDQVHNKFDIPLVSIGKVSLKNVSEPIEVFRMVMPWDEEKKSSPVSFDKRRIAVLPFANISQDPGDEYFADGMTEELITAMSGVQGLQVIARTSVMNYKGGGVKLSTIGNDLRVGSVLEGSVRRAGNKVRITAQLIDVPTESHLWAEKYDRELDDIFSIQDDISGKIAHALQVKLVYTQEPGRKQTESMEAYTLYLKGRYFWNKRNKDSVLNSLNLFEEAIAIDPNYARAYSGMADAYYVAAIYDFMERGEGLAKAREAATKALQLDETLAEAHASLGINLFDNLEYEEAKREFRRAIELNPAYATARQWYSYSLMEWGDKDLAIEEIRKAHELDPLSQVITVALADEITSGGRVDEAMAVLDALLRSSAGYAVAYQYRSTCFALKRMKEEAFADLESGYKLDGDEAKFTVGLAWLSGWFGEEERALRILQEVTQVKGRPPRYPADVALCYAVLGKRDEFFAWVDRAIDMKWFSVWGLRYDPFYDKVRDDPRFPEIFRKLGLPY